MNQKLGAVSIVVLVALLASACAAARAFRRGEEAARAGDWEAAVAHYRRAVQEDPDKPEYKIKLERAMLNAASEYISRARALEEKGQLDLALRAYRRVLELDSANQTAAAKAAELERRIREQVEAARPVPRIEQLRAEARRISPEPILNPASREPINVTFNNAAIRDILNFLGDAAGINVTYDQQAETIVNRGYTVELEGVTFEQALDQVLTANGLFYKVLNPRTIIVIPDTLQKRMQYDELVVRTFFLSHADATEIAQMLVQMSAVQQGVRPVIAPNKTANTVTVRATAAMADVIERIIRANDKPRAEIVLDVEILEVSRTRLKEFGLNLNAYSIDLLFSPEQRPGTGQQGGVTVPPFNLNTISQGVSTADFYLAVPQAVVRFLETDAHSRILAKPQLRGAEGTQLTLNLGQEVPVLQTVFGAAAPGGFATIPQSSFQYRTIGVNLQMTPRVTYEGEIILELSVENSALGPSLQVAGQNVPSFTTRRVTTKLRLREGESNLLAGLIREDSRRSLTGLPGLLRVPGFRQLFSGNRNESEESDIVMLITPHIVRSHELTPEDLAPIYIGTQQRVALGGAPPLIAPQPPREEGGPAAPGEPGAAATPGAPPPVPSLPEPAARPAETPAAPQPPQTPAPEAGTRVVLSPASSEFRVGGGPYLVPISVSGAARLSTVTLTISYDPAVLRARSVQEGTFMRQGGASPVFTPTIDAAAGRVDIAITRPGDTLGASGSGLLAAVLFDAIAPGSATLTVAGTAAGPDGHAIPLGFAPVTVTVR